MGINHAGKRMGLCSGCRTKAKGFEGNMKHRSTGSQWQTLVSSVGALLLVVCPAIGAAEAPSTLDPSYYTKHVAPALEKRCAGACHDNPGPTAAEAQKLVVPGDPAKSVLYRKAKGEESHPATLSADERASLEQWIQGARDTAATGTAAQPSGETKPAATVAESSTKLMGRVDLTLEAASGRVHQARFNNQHYLIFLRAKASPKVSFMGEIASVTNSKPAYFYSMDYRVSQPFMIQLGKILVPFGENSRFHQWYGGVGATEAKMFSAVWAAHGVNTKWSLLSSETLDLYAVQGVGAANGEPNLQSISNDMVAFGFRWTSGVIPKIKLIGSALYQRWEAGRPPLYLVGADLLTEYKLIDVAVLRNLRFGAGSALALISGSASGSYKRYGDYIQLYSNLIPLGELRARFGTYRNNWKVKSQNDTQSFNLAWIVPVDALRVMAEYQWNFEAVNEVDNDLFRLMVSLDF